MLLQFPTCTHRKESHKRKRNVVYIHNSPLLHRRLVSQLSHTQDLYLLLTIMNDSYPHVLPYEPESQAQPFIPRAGRRISAQSHTTEGSPPQHHALPTRLEKLYMSIAAAEAVIVFALASAVFGLVEVNVKNAGMKTKTVPVYLAIFLLSQIFSLLYVFDALRSRNIVQLLLHIWLNFMLLLYAILQIPQTKVALEDVAGCCGNFDRCTGPGSLFNVMKGILIVPPIVFGLALISFGILSRQLYFQFGWDVFRLVGASPELKKMHRAYQTLLSLLKLLLFFAIAFCLAYLILVTAWSANKGEFILTVVALPLVIIVILICGWALRTENKPVMACMLVIMMAGLVYFIYKLATLWLPRTSSLYINTKITMAIFSIFSIIILLVTFIFGCTCMSNFGKGLIEAHQNPENRTSLWSLPANKGWNRKYNGYERESGQTVPQMVIE
ncbi:hypothetical protein AYX15_01581 [Cryptococcus neoformans]|nr:hypothetical protein AYX15_01581 [Cryptococcus neoformans var. grubii]